MNNKMNFTQWLKLYKQIAFAKQFCIDLASKKTLIEENNAAPKINLLDNIIVIPEDQQ